MGDDVLWKKGVDGLAATAQVVSAVRQRLLLQEEYDTHVVGPVDLMESSELTEHQASLGEIDYEIAVPLSEAKAALTRVRDYAKGKRLCMPLIGAFLRFSPVDDHTLVGHSVTDDAAWRQEHHYYGLYRDLALQLVKYHHGRPHWAKNEREHLDDCVLPEGDSQPGWLFSVAARARGRGGADHWS